MPLKSNIEAIDQPTVLYIIYIINHEITIL